MDEITKYLLEYGALGGFCAFLVWSHIKSEKRMESMQHGFQEQIKEISDRHEDRETTLRDRYDGIIAKQDESKERILVDVIARLTSQENKLDDCISTLNAGLTQLRAEVVDLKVNVAQRMG